MLKRTIVVLLVLLSARSAFAQRDAIDLSAAVVHNSPTDVASWSITTRMESMTMSPPSAPESGIAMYFSGRSTWPNYTPPGWDGPIQYTIWAGVNINGVWHVAGFVQMWRERVATGAPLLSYGPGCVVNNFACNWAYDVRWGTMAGYQPHAGEAMVFFATAGNARGVGTVTSVRERTNVVMVNLPANDTGSWIFSRDRSDMVVDLESSGLWSLLDATSYSQIGPGSARTVVTGDIDGNRIDEVVADFGASGIWIRVNGASWIKVHASTANSIVMADLNKDGKKEVVVSFPGAGLWALVNGNTWVQLSSASPDLMAAGDIDGGGDELIVNFPGYGLCVRTSSNAWIRLQTASPTEIITGDFDGNGSADIVVSFPGAGVWMLRNGNSWLWINSNESTHLAAGDVDGSAADELFIDFGPSWGIWYLMNLSTWVPLHNSTSDQIVLADLDGSGKDDIIVDFGPGKGVWILGNTTPWRKALDNSPKLIIPANFN